MLLSKLFEANTRTVFILDLPDPIKEKALAAFKALSDGQRYGDPEKLGGASLRNRGIHCSGLYAGLTEHVGDITHRMTENFEKFQGLYGNCRDKVMLGIGRINDGDMERQVDRNYKYQIEPERDEDAKKWNRESGRFHGSLQDYRNFWRKAGKLYADAHAKLPVWNEAQWHAREAAVKIGLMQFYVALDHLEALKAHMKTQKDWTAYCGQITIDDQGNPVPYKPNLTEKQAGPNRNLALYKQLPSEFNSVSDVLAKYGYEQIGNGNFALTFAKPGEKSVLKLFEDKDDGYKRFVEMCFRHRGNPHFPKMSHSHIKIGDYNAIRMERLSPWHGWSAQKETMVIQDYFFDRLGREELAYQRMGRPDPYPTDEIMEEKIARAHEWMDENPSIKQACEIIIKEFNPIDYCYDIDMRNMMIRPADSELVFIDPVYSYNSIMSK